MEVDFSITECTDLVGCGPAPVGPCVGGGGCGSPQAPQPPPGRPASECRAGTAETTGSRAVTLATPAGSLRPDGLTVTGGGNRERISNTWKDVYNIKEQTHSSQHLWTFHKRKKEKFS